MTSSFEVDPADDVDVSVVAAGRDRTGSFVGGEEIWSADI
jgi:hypothetical protein